jgi:hypothetical protein
LDFLDLETLFLADALVVELVFFGAAAFLGAVSLYVEMVPVAESDWASAMAGLTNIRAATKAATI